MCGGMGRRSAFVAYYMEQGMLYSVVPETPEVWKKFTAEQCGALEGNELAMVPLVNSTSAGWNQENRSDWFAQVHRWMTGGYCKAMGDVLSLQEQNSAVAVSDDGTTEKPTQAGAAPSGQAIDQSSAESTLPALSSAPSVSGVWVGDAELLSLMADAERFRCARLEHEISQWAVAARIDRSQTHVSRFEQGKLRPQNMRQLAPVLWGSLNALIQMRKDGISLQNLEQSSGPEKTTVTAAPARRKRSTFKPADVMKLKEVFALDPSPHRMDRQVLAAQLGLEAGVVTTWFANARQRKKHLESFQAAV
ncbi:hypothetical protein BV898_12948 [Hypsibius exemplaris]|uniref:Homeobox domain-containing protein n=1 Tax=Hypsibius exemplaris TaxID=2072580 RepID=A0A1W0WC85_HYPEX|nr:hypothetical protein BV898_12948 [Hypsibius exemplaris]